MFFSAFGRCLGVAFSLDRGGAFGADKEIGSSERDLRRKTKQRIGGFPPATALAGTSCAHSLVNWVCVSSFVFAVANLMHNCYFRMRWYGYLHCRNK